MINLKNILLVCITLSLKWFSINDIYSQNNNLLELKGPYLGQKSPGKTPEVFAPGIVCTDALEFGITISNDGNDIYFSRRESRNHSSKIYSYKYKNDQWILEGPLLLGWDGSESEPNLTPDGNRMYFCSRMPLPNQTEKKGRVWYVEKINKKWSTPTNVIRGMFATQSNNETLYLTRFNPIMGINSMKVNPDGFDQPKLLPPVINQYLNAAHPYIAPDESYIIYDYNVQKGSGARNLLISYKTEDSWTEPINLTDYLGIKMENSNIPFVSFDGKYFFFSSNGNIYWCNASFIEELKPKISR